MAEMYFGTYEQTLDAKNRFTVPSAFKKDIPEKMCILVTLGKYPHIDFFPDNEVYQTELAGRKAAMSRSTPAPIIQALFNGNTDVVVLDKQGRTNALPLRLLDNAKIKRDLIVMGNGSYISVYDLSVYNKLIADATKVMESRDEAMLSATYKEDEAIAEGAYLAVPGAEE